MGLSVASLFGYRTGAIKISTKGWGKLEQAERLAGLRTSAKDAGSFAKPNEPGLGGTTQRVLGENIRDTNEAAVLRHLVESLTARVDKLEGVLAQMAAAVVSVIERTEDRGPRTASAALESLRKIPKKKSGSAPKLDQPPTP